MSVLREGEASAPTYPSVSIILPVYRQATQITSIVEGYVAGLARIPAMCELLLVANGGGDDSGQVCRELAARFSTVRSFELEHGGWGRAVRLGLGEARGDVLCYTNTARTTVDDLLLMLLYALTQPNAVVKANRKIRDNWRRRLGSLLYNLECRALFDLPNWDVNGTPKVFPRAFGRLLDLQRNDDLIDAEFCLICRESGYPMLEVPVFSTRRQGGTSTTNYRSALRMYLGAYALWRSVRGRR